MTFDRHRQAWSTTLRDEEGEQPWSHSTLFGSAWDSSCACKRRQPPSIYPISRIHGPIERKVGQNLDHVSPRALLTFVTGLTIMLTNRGVLADLSCNLQEFKFEDNVSYEAD